MSENELLIKINADAKSVDSAYKDIQSKTEDLDEALSKVAKVSAVAFAALSAQVVVSLRAFAEAEQSSRALSQALQNQGIFTSALKEQYKGYANEVEKVTGFQADEIVKAQAIAQGFLGQIPITKDLTKAIADLAQGQGISLPQAAETLGKAIANGTGALLREGLQISATSTEAERYGKVLDFVTLKYGGQAEAANQGLGAIRGLTTAFQNAQQELGSRFAPAAEAVIHALTEFFTISKGGSSTLTDLKAIVIAVGLGMTALGVALPIAAQGILAIRAAALAMNLVLNGTKIALAGLGIGLVLILLTELALHWDTVSSRIKVVVKGLVEFVSGAFHGLGQVITGAFHLNVDEIKAGLSKITAAFKEGAATATQELPKATEKAGEEQKEQLKKFANQQNAILKEREQFRIALQKAENEAIILDLKNASEQSIQIKKEEITTLKALEQSRVPEQIALLKQRYAELQKEEEAQRQIDLQKSDEFYKEDLEARERYHLESLNLNTLSDQKELAQVKAQTDTLETAQKKVYLDEIKREQKQHNDLLQDRIKYGVAVAAINQTLHSKEVEGVKSANSELVGLQNSHNTALKNIGKAAAVADITVKTAQSAMNVVEGFSSIPFIGTALGIAAAAAVIAYGGEQIGTVLAANQGGLVTGGISGTDSVPSLLTPGELVAPASNFNEVIGSVRAAREAEKQGGSFGGGVAVVELHLKDNLVDFVEAQIVERKNLHISIQGT